jgi:hypothetical protein
MLRYLQTMWVLAALAFVTLVILAVALSMMLR